jgi:hypothetical protein
LQKKHKVKNELKEEKKEKKPKKQRRVGKVDSKVGKALRGLLDGSILTRENAVRLLPFILFLTAICIGYIANSYLAEKTLRKADKIRKDLEELENEYISTKSELMMCSKQSQVVIMLDSTGVVESLNPPKKIFVKSEKTRNTDLRK